MRIVHMVGFEEGAELPEGEVPSVRTRCGRSIDRPVVSAGPVRYDLVASNGNQFFCTTHPLTVTCVKCRNLLTTGTIYAKPPKRAVAHASAPALRAARPTARTRISR